MLSSSRARRASSSSEGVGCSQRKIEADHDWKEKTEEEGGPEQMHESTAPETAALNEQHIAMQPLGRISPPQKWGKCTETAVKYRASFVRPGPQEPIRDVGEF